MMTADEDLSHSATAVQLTEDQADDLLYLARVGDLAELQQTVDEISGGGGGGVEARRTAVLAAAVDSGSGNTLLHMAAANGHEDVLKYALECASSGSSSTSVPTPAAPAGSMASTSGTQTAPSASALLTRTLDRRNASGNTALHWAALNGRLGAARLLAEAGADLGAENAGGLDALAEAERAGHDAVARMLLARMAGRAEGDLQDPEPDGSDGVQPLDGHAAGPGPGSVAAAQDGLRRLGLADGEDAPGPAASGGAASGTAMANGNGSRVG